MRKTAAVLLAWYFVLTAGTYVSGRVVGPFHDKATCERVRAEMSHSTSQCWSSAGFIR